MPIVRALRHAASAQLNCSSRSAKNSKSKGNGPTFDEWLV
jgi:hypothetical protein